MSRIISKNFGLATIRNFQLDDDFICNDKLVIKLHNGRYVGRGGLESWMEKDILFDTLENAEEALTLYLLKQAGSI